MSVLKTLLASAIAASSVSAAFAGGLNTVASEPEPIVAVGPAPSFDSLGGAVVPAVLGLVVLAAVIASDDDDDADDTSATSTAAE